MIRDIYNFKYLIYLKNENENKMNVVSDLHKSLIFYKLNKKLSNEYQKVDYLTNITKNEIINFHEL